MAKIAAVMALLEVGAGALGRAGDDCWYIILLASLMLAAFKGSLCADAEFVNLTPVPIEGERSEFD